MIHISTLEQAATPTTRERRGRDRRATCDDRTVRRCSLLTLDGPASIANVQRQWVLRPALQYRSTYSTRIYEHTRNSTDAPRTVGTVGPRTGRAAPHVYSCKRHRHEAAMDPRPACSPAFKHRTYVHVRATFWCSRSRGLGDGETRTSRYRKFYRSLSAILTARVAAS